MEFFLQSGVHGNIFRVEHGYQTSIANGETLSIKVVDTETLTLGYPNFNYGAGSEPLRPVSPIYATWLCWSFSMFTTFIGTGEQRSGLVLRIQLGNWDSTPAEFEGTSFDPAYEYTLPLYGGVGERPNHSGEVRVQAKYAQIEVENNTNQAQVINYFVYGKVL